MDTLKTWQEMEPGETHPAVVELYCHECGRRERVDRAFIVRGDYYCDGTQVLTLRMHKVDNGMPSMVDVFRAEHKLSGEPLEWLRVIHAEARDLAEHLEAYIYLYGDRDGGGDNPA